MSRVSLISSTRDLNLVFNYNFGSVSSVSSAAHSSIYFQALSSYILNNLKFRIYEISVSFYQYLPGVWGRSWGEGFPISKLLVFLRSIPRNLILHFIFIQRSNVFQINLLFLFSTMTRTISLNSYYFNCYLDGLFLYWCCSSFNYWMYLVIPLTRYPQWPLFYLILRIYNYILDLLTQTYFLQHV